MGRSNDGDAARDTREVASAEAARERKREWARRYRLEHPEEHAAKRRRWIEANRDRIRESNARWRAEHLERAREINRESMRRAAARKRRDAAQRAKARERARLWREAHPDRVRDYQREWVAANSEKVREYYNRYYRAHRDEVNARATARRDADPEGTKQRQQAWAASHQERRAELQRERRADPAVYAAELEANAAARRLKRALARAGLPPKRLHPSTAAERRANDRAADAFFADPAFTGRLQQLQEFCNALVKHMLNYHAGMREFAESYISTRQRMGLPSVQVDDVMWARAVDIVLDKERRRVDLLTSRDVAAAVRTTKETLRQAQRREQLDWIVGATVTNVQGNRAALLADAELENRARRLRGKPAIALERLVVMIAMQEASERVSTDLLDGAATRRALGEAITRLAEPEGAKTRAMSGRDRLGYYGGRGTRQTARPRTDPGARR
ncbi:hypothetical protein GE115_02660 [Agromyces sp. CFH 90414]|uniref:Uncharacterized protein n=1 Tax=Agromyces agglutinans TaxID=2662258 RepID=A0A6I2F2M5_9MICO|nr:hypothetical protein [Agromyces agglutinans]MRG58779.1 hypothetical protein [Agromyces agglutinans]